MQRIIKDLLNPYHLERYGNLIGGRIPHISTPKSLSIGEHLLYFNPVSKQLGTDGYYDDQSPGMILKDANLKYSRRVWAQGTIDVAGPLEFNREYKCQEKLQFIKKVRGDHYVCIERLISGDDKQMLLRETRTLAYTNSLARESTSISIDSSDSISIGSFTFQKMDIVIYGQLSLNPHRIHWDRTYSCEKEGYKNIIVQGPFALQVLLRYAQNYIQSPVSQVRYRNYNYIYPNTRVEILVRSSSKNYQVWMRDSENRDIVFLKADMIC